MGHTRKIMGLIIYRIILVLNTAGFIGYGKLAEFHNNYDEALTLPNVA